MTFIPETTIDKAAERLNEEEGAYETAVEDLRRQQPVLLSYLFSENFEAFTAREQEFLLYLALVIFRAAEQERGLLPAVTERQLSEVEEHNWGLLQGVSSSRFHERLDVFFQDSPQEDLLAFVEDALSDDSDDIVTKEGREAMFVSLKSIIDCLTL
jgi:hypothetical protein